jgi:hypothetical protein
LLIEGRARESELPRFHKEVFSVGGESGRVVDDGTRHDSFSSINHEEKPVDQFEVILKLQGV